MPETRKQTTMTTAAVKTTMEALTEVVDVALPADLAAAGWTCVRRAGRRSHGYHGVGAITQVAYKFNCFLNGTLEYFEVKTLKAAVASMRSY